MSKSGFIGNCEGGAAIEFAITAPIYFLLLFGLALVALWLWTDFSLQRAVDVASRCAVILPTASAAVGLSVPTSAFTVTTPACGKKVAASYAAPSFASGFGLPTLTINVSACYPT